MIRRFLVSPAPHASFLHDNASHAQLITDGPVHTLARSALRGQGLSARCAA